MAVFRYALQPWVDDRGYAWSLASVGRGVDIDAAVAHLYHDWETDTHLYGYWGSGIFGKVFVTEVRCPPAPDPTWEIQIGPLQYDPPRSVAPSPDERTTCIERIVDALSQWPEGDFSKAIPGQIVRRIEIKLLLGRDVGQ